MKGSRFRVPSSALEQNRMPADHQKPEIWNSERETPGT